MSLINDVLKDLERRDASGSAAAPTSARRNRPSPPRAWRWPLWIIGALAVGVILHLSLEGRSLIQRADPDMALTAQAAPHAGRSPSPSPSGLSAQTTARSTEASTAIDAESSNHVSMAAQSATVTPATTPPSTQSERASEPSRAVEGDRAQPEAEEAAVPEKSQNNSPEPVPPQTSTRPEETRTGGADETEEATISIRRAQGEQVETDALADAKRLLSRGQVQRAESSLRQLVAEQPGLTQAHELLANTLIRRRQHDAAVRVLESGLPQAQDPAPLAALLGRLLLERGEIARARTVLDQHAPAMASATDYHLLLAAAHRQAGDHERAAKHYRELAEHLPRRGAVWIGLGASLESLDRPQEAASAYNRALDGDDDRAAHFARERLSALEPLTGEPQ